MKIPPVVTVGAIIAGVLACAPAGPDRSVQRPHSATTPRTFLSLEWDTLFIRGGPRDDTMLSMPARIALGNDRLIVLDSYERRAIALDYHGNVIWVAGRRGHGPGEFEAFRDLRVGNDGSLWILDPRNARVSHLSAAGEYLGAVPLGRVKGYVDDIAYVAGDTLTVISHDREKPVVSLSASGEVLIRKGMPIPGYENMHSLVSQVVSASSLDGESWVAAYQVADGFAGILRREGSAHDGWFIEPIPTPQVVMTRTPEGRRTGMEDVAFAAMSLSIRGDTAMVLFAGLREPRQDKVDMYSLRDGHYFSSLRLPVEAAQIATADDHIAAIIQDPYPGVVLLRPRARVTN